MVDRGKGKQLIGHHRQRLHTEQLQREVGGGEAGKGEVGGREIVGKKAGVGELEGRETHTSGEQPDAATHIASKHIKVPPSIMMVTSVA